MSRSIGVVDFIQGILPDWIGLVAGLVTQLGDTWFILVLILLLVVLNRDKSSKIAVLGLTWLFGKFSYKSLKNIFGMPRPESPIMQTSELPNYVQPIYEATAFSGGYGFPSGHAVNVTIIYFGLAMILDYGELKQRLIVSSVIVVTVAFTRIILGLHYLVDVSVGIFLGLVICSMYYLLFLRDSSYIAL